MGTPQFAVDSLVALVAAGHTVAAVYTQPDRPKGRGQELAISPVKEAALRHGLKNRIDPGAETTGNGYENSANADQIPRDWRSAIAAAKGSEFLKSALGPDLHRTFVAIKESEYLRVARTIADVDYQLYLHEV